MSSDQLLDHDALTIGFGRRFATYKRATLLLRDPDRLARLLNDPNRPVQILFAGKSHPRDEPGKVLIQQIVRQAQEERFRRRLVFLEDYDMAMARALVQGCDIWLNTPRRPLEDSGTSGMKAAANGVLNVSTLDGWWDEAWRDLNPPGAGIGWAIGRGESYASPDEQDQVEAEALYDLLERDVVPTFYTRAADGLPQSWIERMKAYLSSLVPAFNGQRMVREYTETCYLPAAAQVRRLAEDDMTAARALATWRERVEGAWSQLAVGTIEAGSNAEVRVSDTVEVRARVQLGGLRPEDVAVELYLGRVDARGELSNPVPLPMQVVGPGGTGCWIFGTTVAPGNASGLHGYTVRVRPNHAELARPFELGLVTWAGPTIPAIC